MPGLAATSSDKWSHWVGSWITVAVLTVLLVVELVTDQLPKTPSRKTHSAVRRPDSSPVPSQAR